MLGLRSSGAIITNLILANMTREEQEQERDGQDMDSDTGSNTNTSNRGFASMDEEKQREIASKGGKSQGKDVNPANFANDREKAAAAGRIGGQNSRGGGRTKEDSTDSTDSEE